MSKGTLFIQGSVGQVSDADKAWDLVVKAGEEKMDLADRLIGYKEKSIMYGFALKEIRKLIAGKKDTTSMAIRKIILEIQS